jgi:hypothetical protein
MLAVKEAAIEDVEALCNRLPRACGACLVEQKAVAEIEQNRWLQLKAGMGLRGQGERNDGLAARLGAPEFLEQLCL